MPEDRSGRSVEGRQIAARRRDEHAVVGHRRRGRADAVTEGRSPSHLPGRLVERRQRPCVRDVEQTFVRGRRPGTARQGRRPPRSSGRRIERSHDPRAVDREHLLAVVGLTGDAVCDQIHGPPDRRTGVLVDGGELRRRVGGGAPVNEVNAPARDERVGDAQFDRRRRERPDGRERRRKGGIQRGARVRRIVEIGRRHGRRRTRVAQLLQAGLGRVSNRSGVGRVGRRNGRVFASIRARGGVGRRRRCRVARGRRVRRGRAPIGRGTDIRRTAAVLGVDARRAVQCVARPGRGTAGQQPGRQSGQPRNAQTRVTEGTAGRAHGQFLFLAPRGPSRNDMSAQRRHETAR